MTFFRRRKLLTGDAPEEEAGCFRKASALLATIHVWRNKALPFKEDSRRQIR
jgi:hypothetical protein